MNDDQVINDLDLVYVFAIKKNTLRVLECHAWVQLMNLDFTRGRTEMKHNCFVVDAADKELVFIFLFVKSLR